MNRLDQAIDDINGKFCGKSQCYGFVFLPTPDELESSNGFFLWPGDLFFGHQRNRKIYFQNNPKVSWGREPVSVSAFLAKIILDGLTPVGVPKADDLALSDPDYYFALMTTEKNNSPNGWHWYVCYDGEWAEKNAYDPAKRVSADFMKELLNGKDGKTPFFLFKVPKKRPNLCTLQPLQDYHWGTQGIGAYRTAYRLLSMNKTPAPPPREPSGLIRIGSSLIICSRPDPKTSRFDRETWPTTRTPMGYIPGYGT